MMKSSTLLLTSRIWFSAKLHKMMMVTFTKLLEIKIVASSFSGFASKRFTESRVLWLLNLSKSVSLSEKYAISEPETKAETHRHNNATMHAIMLDVVGVFTEIRDCAISAVADIKEKMHDKGSVSKIQ